MSECTEQYKLVLEPCLNYALDKIICTYHVTIQNYLQQLFHYEFTKVKLVNQFKLA